MLLRGTETGVKGRRIFCLLFIFFTLLGKVTASFKKGTPSPGYKHTWKENWGLMLSLIDIHNTRQMSQLLPMAQNARTHKHLPSLARCS